VSALTHRFEFCPLCAALASAATEFKIADASGHPLYRPELPRMMRWLRCAACDHVFTEHYWSAEGERILFSTSLPYQLPESSQSEHLRNLWAPTVRRVAAILAETRGRPAAFGARGAARPRWLDVGFGAGGLVMTADEFGFAATGADVRAEAVTRLAALGYDATCASFDNIKLEAPLSVLSMADVLEHLPSPPVALAKASTLLERDGLLYISCPNSETATWRLWEQTGTNPYWGELEHYHNFSREKLIGLLDAHGFEVIDYNVSTRYYSCMEITARKRDHSR
jgi:SAM-dependent methyltransferase